jgi:hypothetical protein
MRRANAESLFRWVLVASEAAKVANERFFDSHRGVEFDPVRKVVIIYNNHPYEDRPERRDRELADLETFCRERSWPVLGKGSWPRKGKQADYTRALIVRAPESAVAAIVERYHQVTAATYDDRPALRVINGGKADGGGAGR